MTWATLEHMDVPVKTNPFITFSLKLTTPKRWEKNGKNDWKHEIHYLKSIFETFPKLSFIRFNYVWNINADEIEYLIISWFTRVNYSTQIIIIYAAGWIQLNWSRFLRFVKLSFGFITCRWSLNVASQFTINLLPKWNDEV